MGKFEQLPEELREKAISDVFCIHCQKSFRMDAFTEREFRGALILEGKCPTCGESCAKPVGSHAG